MFKDNHLFVLQVFLTRSWASLRVMTAGQRGELLRRIVMENPEKKLLFKECEKIAKDLNLTLEQVSLLFFFFCLFNVFLFLSWQTRMTIMWIVSTA